MKKILFILFCSVASIGASAQTGKVSVNGVCCTTSLKEEYFLEQLALNY